MIPATRVLSEPTRRVLVLFLDAGGGELYGGQILATTLLSSGTLYPLLQRLAHKGLLEARPEAGDAHTLRRPLRTFYRLTPTGHTIASRLAAETDGHQT